MNVNVQLSHPESCSCVINIMDRDYTIKFVHENS